MSISQNFPAISPTLNLNFARSKKLDPRITFTRTSSATRTNAQGLIEVVSTDTPRFEHSYNSSTGSVNSLGLLIEESRSNLITYSEDISQYNAIDNASVSTNQIISPDGTTTADKLTSTITGGSNNCHVQKLSTVTIDTTTYTFSVFLKAGTSPQTLINLQLAGGTYQQSTATINWTSNTITSSSGGTSALTAYPNGWYRVSITLTNNGTNNGVYPRVYVRGQGTDNVNGEFVYTWGWQTEAGAFPTSYIPTVASTVTRSGDLAFIDLPSTGWYNYSQGSLVFQHSTVPFATGTTPGYPSVGFAQTNGSSTNSILYFITKSGGGGQYLVRDAGTDQANITPPTGAPAAKVGFAYTTNLFVLARNGSEVGTDTSGTVPQSIGTLLLGGNEKIVGYNFNACISNVIYYPRALSSSQLQNLTK